MKYYYEYKIKNGAKVGGHNLEKINLKDGVIILEGVDTLMDCDGEYGCHWRSVINDGEIEYLKIEPMEEDKDIELLDVALLSQSDNWLWCPSKEDFEKDIELNSYIISNIRENTLSFQRKLNEVIKEVNKLRKKL